MSTGSDPLKLLVVGGSDDDAAALAAPFREAGHEVTLEHVDDHEQVSLGLGRGPFDLAIATPFNGEMPLDKIGAAIGVAVPWIAVVPGADSDSMLAALEAGAAHAVDRNQPRALLLCGLREIRLGQRLAAGGGAETVTEPGEEAIALFSDGMILEANEAFATLLGYDSPDDLDCMPVIDLIAEQDKDKFKGFLKNLGARPSDIGISVARSDGEEVLVPMTLSSVTREGEVCKQIVVHSSESSQSGGLSMNDSVTGLINRQFFLDHLAAALMQAANVTTIDHVLLVSIDQFDTLVGRHGLPGADAILHDLSNLLRSRADKFNYLSRFGDGSLALMLPNSDADSAIAYAKEICAMVAEHIADMNGQTVQYTVTIGIAALNAKSPRNPVELLDQCRQAIVEVREKAANNGIGNDANLFARASKAVAGGAAKAGEKTEEAIDLDSAIDQGRMCLVFQPVLSIKGDAGEHYEAFVRMNTPKEQLQPASFMGQVAATPKLGIKLDRWVILEGIKQLGQQRSQGKDTRLIINLTVHSMEDSGLTGWLKVAMQAGDVPPNSLIFQLSESDFTRNINQGKEFGDRIKSIGCHVSISHFGVGANDPGTVLKHLPLDYVKLAPKYASELRDGSGDPQPMKELIARINAEKKMAMVPNVESASLLAILWQAGANFIQGMYLQPPMSEMNYEFSDIA